MWHSAMKPLMAQIRVGRISQVVLLQTKIDIYHLFVS